MDGAIRRAKSRCRRGCLFICLPWVSCLKECGEDERRDEHPLGTLFGCPAVQGCWPRAAAAPRSPLVGSCPHCKPPGGRSDRRAASSSRRVEVKPSRGFIKGDEKLSGLCPNMSYFAHREQWVLNCIAESARGEGAAAWQKHPGADANGKVAYPRSFCWRNHHKMD